MGKPNILNEEALSLTEVKNHLSKSKKEVEELNFRANRTYEFLSSIKLQSLKNAGEIFKKVQDLDIPRLKDSHIKKVIDLMPKTEQEIDIIFQGLPVTINKDNKKKILDVVQEYL